MLRQLHPGDRYGTFVVVGQLGEGGHAAVYEVVTPQGHHRALKLHGFEPRNRDRLAQEARLLARLENPHVVRFFDVGWTEGELWLLLELIRGETLREKLRQLQPMEDVLRWMEHVCAGVAAAHAIGVFHRDLKPENIMITADDLAKVIDFGLAKPKLTDAGVATTKGVVLGTALYTAPEVFDGAPASFQSEVYSLGMVMYEALAGAHPLGSPTSNPVEVFRRVKLAPRRPLAEVAPDVPADLARIVDRAIDREPSVRWPNVTEMREEMLKAHDQLLTRRRALADNVVPNPKPSHAPTVPLPAVPSVQGSSLPVSWSAVRAAAGPLLGSASPAATPIPSSTALGETPATPCSAPGAGAGSPPRSRGIQSTEVLPAFSVEGGTGGDRAAVPPPPSTSTPTPSAMRADGAAPRVAPTVAMTAVTPSRSSVGEGYGASRAPSLLPRRRTRVLLAVAAGTALCAATVATWMVLAPPDAPRPVPGARPPGDASPHPSASASTSPPVVTPATPTASPVAPTSTSKRLPPRPR